jgi:hypothetical protein
MVKSPIFSLRRKERWQKTAGPYLLREVFCLLPQRALFLLQLAHPLVAVCTHFDRMEVFQEES